MSQVVFEIVQVSAQSPRSNTLVEQWNERRRNFTEADLHTELWEDFHDALACFAEGDADSVHEWLDEQESIFLAAWEQYEDLSIVSTEITKESVLCHLYLRDGVENWLEAMAGLRESLESKVSVSQEVLQFARIGQGYLIAVQMLETQIDQERDYNFGAYQQAA